MHIFVFFTVFLQPILIVGPGGIGGQAGQPPPLPPCSQTAPWSLPPCVQLAKLGPGSSTSWMCSLVALCISCLDFFVFPVWIFLDFLFGFFLVPGLYFVFLYCLFGNWYFCIFCLIFDTVKGKSLGRDAISQVLK